MMELSFVHPNHDHVAFPISPYIMLYGTEGGGRGRKSKYMVLPRGGRVKFDFLNAPARWPSPVWFFELTCRAAESN